MRAVEQHGDRKQAGEDRELRACTVVPAGRVVGHRANQVPDERDDDPGATHRQSPGSACTVDGVAR